MVVKFTVYIFHAKDPEKVDPSKDVLHVMVANPSSLYSMRYKDENIQQLELRGLIESSRGIYPNISMSTLGGKLDGCLLIHDENVDLIFGFYQKRTQC
jgi:hypothetical protein